MFDKLCKNIFVLFVILITNNCTSDDILSPEVPNVIQSENIYLLHNKWIFSQMNRNYYWRTEMPDSLSCDYSTDPVTFYKSLLYKKDRFSYCENNPSYTGISELANYGFEYQNYTLRDISFSQILYVLNEDVKNQGLRRGDIIQFLDNNRISRGKIVKDNYIPSDTFLLSKNPLDDNKSVYMDSIYSEGDNRIGYICYLKFEDKNELEPILKKFWENNIDELILDLRYNPGGYVNTCKYLANSIVSENGYGKVFQYCTYNDILSEEMLRLTGNEKSVSMYSTPNNGVGFLGSSLYGLNLKRLFVITSKYSASASEATIICLKPFMDVIIIGEQTYGKGVGSWTIRDDRYKYQIQPITMRYHNANMETTPDDGIPVDYFMEDGYSTSKKELGDVNEPLLNKVLSIISNNDKQTRVANNNEQENHDIKAIGTPSYFKIKTNNYENNF